MKKTTEVGGRRRGLPFSPLSLEEKLKKDGNISVFVFYSGISAQRSRVLGRELSSFEDIPP